MQKKVVFVALMIAMITLTQIEISPVYAIEAEETYLPIISGSSVNDTTFESNEHLVADGFAVNITMDLPTPKSAATQTKVGFAVGLGNEWEDTAPGVYLIFTPYVEEMWCKVDGGDIYTIYPGGIYENGGTGGHSVSFFEWILWGLEIAFLAKDIYGLLNDIYEEPRIPEWQPETPTHWAKAVTYQPISGIPGYRLIGEPRLQTAGANFLSYFLNDGPQTLTITAGAKVCLQVDNQFSPYVFHYDIGTYEVSFEVEVPVGVYDLTTKSYRTDETQIFDVPVYIDDEYVGETPWTEEIGYGTHSVKVDSVFYRGDYKYEFQYWEDDDTSNPRTVSVLEDRIVRAYYDKIYVGDDGDGGDGGWGFGCPMLSVYDGTGYVEEGYLDIHNPDGVDVVTSHVLVHTPEAVEHRYVMRLTEHPQTHSHIDQVQLYATVKNGTEIRLPLVSAVHSEDGDVLQQLLVSDDVRTDTLGADLNNGTSECIDLKFVAPDGLEIEGFTFIIEGYNPLFKP